MNSEKNKRKLIDETETATYKKIGASFDAYLDAKGDDDMSLKDCEELLTILSSYLSGEHKQTADDFFRFGLANASTVAAKDEDSRILVETAIHQITMGAAYILNEVICKDTDRERKSQSNFLQYKDREAKDKALEIADEFWKNDTDEEYRVGEAAQIVSNELVRKGYGKYSQSTIHKWIKDPAPKYARKGGKRKES